jgi:hypothetical protein
VKAVSSDQLPVASKGEACRSFDFPLNSSGLPPFRHVAYDWWEFERAFILGKVMDQHGNWVDRPTFQEDWGFK